MLVTLHRVQLGDATLMAAPFESSFEPDADYPQGELFGDQSLADRKHIGIVMLAGKPRRFFVPAQRTAHAVHLIRHHCFAISRAAEDDAALALAARYCFGCRPNKKRIIHRFLAKRPEIFHLVPERAEQLFHLFLVTKSSVIRPERDFHRAYPLCSFASSFQICLSRSVIFFGIWI